MYATFKPAKAYLICILTFCSVADIPRFILSDIARAIFLLILPTIPHPPYLQHLGISVISYPCSRFCFWIPRASFLRVAYLTKHFSCSRQLMHSRTLIQLAISRFAYPKTCSKNKRFSSSTLQEGSPEAFDIGSKLECPLFVSFPKENLLQLALHKVGSFSIPSTDFSGVSRTELWLYSHPVSTLFGRPHPTQLGRSWTSESCSGDSSVG